MMGGLTEDSIREIIEKSNSVSLECCHIFTVSFLYFVQSSELDKLVFHSYYNGKHVN